MSSFVGAEIKVIEFGSVLGQVTRGVAVGSELVESDISEKEESLDTGVATIGTLAEGMMGENLDVCPKTSDTIMLVLDESDAAEPVSEVEVAVLASAVNSGLIRFFGWAVGWRRIPYSSFEQSSTVDPGSRIEHAGSRIEQIASMRGRVKCVD